MQTEAYLIRNNQVICEAKTNLKSGEIVEFSRSTVEEKIDANREHNLVNSKSAKISRAKKWKNKSYYHAVEINKGKFLVV